MNYLMMYNNDSNNCRYKWVFVPANMLEKASELFKIKDINKDIIQINDKDFIMAYVKI